MEKVFIDRLDHKGRGIGYINGKIIFVDGATPEEEVMCTITCEKKNYCEGRIEQVIKKSDCRVNPNCSYYESCGGCNIMHIDYKRQLLFKKKKLEDILKKYASIKIDINDIIKSEEFHYRNKITLKIDKEIGLYKKKSNKIIPINKCLIVNSNINRVINDLSKFNFDNLKQIVIKSSIITNEIMVVFDNKVNVEVIEVLKKYVSSIYIGEKLIYGNKYLMEKLGEYKFLISPQAFFQVNTNQALNMYNQVLKYCNLNKEDSVLDLYCGTGTISIFLSKYCKEVVGIEINPDSIKNAFLNSENNNVSNTNFYVGDADKVINKINFKPSVIVVDPPRSGLTKKIIDFILKTEAKRVVYVSCDPMTLTRDINILKEKYDLKNVTLIDMFPNTYHCESITVLERKNVLK